MRPTGEGRLPVLFVAEAPGRNEDEQSTQLVGQAGQELRDVLAESGLNLDRDFRKTNAVCCRSPDNRKPTPEEVMACRPMLMDEIERSRPAVIVPLGATALESLWQGKADGLSVTRWRGLCVPDWELGCWVCPTFHPSYVMRSEHNAAVRLIFSQDVIAAVRKASEPLDPSERFIPTVHMEVDFCKIITGIRDITHNEGIVAVDFETTGKKPHRPEHRIVCCAIAGENGTLAFPTGDKLVRDALAEFLSDGSIGKVASNMKFEDAWSREKLGVPVAGWEWDTMLAAHVEDNRRGGTGLKFLAASRYGLFGYDRKIEPYFEPRDTSEARMGANALNRIDQCNLDDLLTYCGWDAAIEYRLAMEQMERMGI
jgi:uracil-DNA glycosylase family 4